MREKNKRQILGIQKKKDDAAWQKVEDTGADN